ncbi:MAG: permease [Deltaproteobacteria bacterium]|nr:permease [Deltaproteobacteria bacterium]
MLDHITGIAVESFYLLAAMAPYLFLGIIVAGLMHVLMPVETVTRHFGRPGIGSVLRASALGVPLPLCSCGVVPVAASLKKSGASSGAVVGFLVTTPTSGVDSILATYSLLGAGFAVIRVVISFILGLGAGIAASFVRSGKNEPAAQIAENPQPHPRENKNWIANGLGYGFGELLGGIAKPLAIGTLLGGLISYLVPPGILEKYVGQGMLSYLVMLAVGIPLYVCASGSIPLAAALMAKGISPGAAMIFLLVGPATNAATISVVSNMLGRRILAIYLAFLTVGALGAGFVTDAFFSWFPALLPGVVSGHSHNMQSLNAFELVSGSLLGLLTIYHLMLRTAAWFKRRKSPAQDGFVLRVDDMTCQHCAATITKAVTDLPGVGSINTDPATKLVWLDLDDSADEDLVVQAIVDAGFHPKKT